ncbi:MAG: type II secretion system ATPase GspE [Gemmataceae bacterium]|nr:type II secretion system ATPase GspE [Gemmataceae bacterium]
MRPAQPPAAGAKPAQAPAAKPAQAPAAKPPTPAKSAAAPAEPKKPAAPKPKSASFFRRDRLGQILVDLKYIEEAQLEKLQAEAQELNQSIGQVALSHGIITEQQLIQALAQESGLKVVDLNDVKPTPAAIEAVPETMASLYKILPLTYEDGVLTIATADPYNLAALDDLRNLLGFTNVQAVLAPPRLLEDTIHKNYAGKEESILEIIQQLENDPDLKKKRKADDNAYDLASLMELQDSAPVRKLINVILLTAIKDHASDIHFEPFEDEYKLRYRCDGVLYEMIPPPRHLAAALSSRIKVMANLDIAERRLPQDGRIELSVAGHPVDLRVSVLPTMFGESVVIRVLDRTVVNLSLDNLAMEPDTLAAFRQLIRKPNGIVLVTGPTGAGKTTTLYSALSELNQITDKIITTEDPVEYEIDGICQCPINPEVDLTFASALRAILRQDPDIILVGEIRDLETAQIAVQASLTGHLVFSTLHTNDAPSTITRLRDMGVEPYLITATLEGIMAQRLVRRICTDCRTEYKPSPEQLMELNLRPQDVAGKKFYYGTGCERCSNTGFRGRMGIYELIVMNDQLRDLISKGASTDQLRAAVRQQGVRNLRDAGLRAVFNGMTTIEEVVRETVLEDED